MRFDIVRQEADPSQISDRFLPIAPFTIWKFINPDRGRLHLVPVGKFVMHCHQLIYQDNGMISQFEGGQGGVDPITIAPAKAL